MNKFAAVRRLILFALLTAAATACQGEVTSPIAVGTKAHRDSIEGDSTLCHSGFEIMSGRIVCNES